MAKFYDEIDDELAAFIAAQPVFFVATATDDSRVNLSPKGMDTLRVLDGNTVAYLDLTGSGNETAAHLTADGRVTIMLCSFDRTPQIARLYGRGEVVALDTPRGRELAPHFPELPGARQLIVVHVDAAQTSCGYGVPVMTPAAERDTLVRWCESKGEDGLRDYRREHNTVSIDGIPAPNMAG